MLYRRISSSLSAALYDRLLVNRIWSEQGARQLKYDFQHGFLLVGRQAGIKRRLTKAWELLSGGIEIMALPGTATASNGHGAIDAVTFSKVMQLAFDDSEPEGEGSPFRKILDQLGVGERLGRREVQAVLKRRPECWR